jgi:hypothetical protein
VPGRVTAAARPVVSRHDAAPRTPSILGVGYCAR